MNELVKPSNNLNKFRRKSHSFIQKQNLRNRPSGKARLDQHDVEYLIEGPVSPGAAEVLLATDTDLTAGNTWAVAGYTVTVWLTPAENDTLRDGLAELVRAAVRGTGLSVPANWPVTAYHHLVSTDDAARHLAVVRQTSSYPLETLPVPVTQLEARVSALCGRTVRVFNLATDKAEFHLRIVRPHHSDNNPLHRDAWLDRLRNGVNIYFSVAGSTADSSLALAPGSHWWAEDQTHPHPRRGCV